MGVAKSQIKLNSNNMTVGYIKRVEMPELLQQSIEEGLEVSRKGGFIFNCFGCTPQPVGS